MDVQDIKISEILYSDDFNCRGKIVPADVIDLAKNIDQQGLIAPVVVTRMGGTEEHPWRLLAGFRRYMAHKVLKKTTISASINTSITSEIDAIALNLSENVSRKDLNLEQEARTVGRLMEQYGTRREVIADKLDISPGWVQTRKMIYDMGPDVMTAAGAGMIRISDVRPLYKIFRATEKDYDHAAALEKVADTIHDLKVLKEKKGNGKATVEESIMKKADAKKHRTRGEIVKMLDHMLDQLPAGLYSRAMAWCSGEIKMSEFEADLDEFAESKGRHYTKLADKEDWS